MNVYCNNCGNKGHIYKHCKFPVLSYGVICFTNDKHILMIQRKDSINYIEFLRGKYKLDDITYIIKLLDGFSIDERSRLLNHSFDDLWTKLWFSGKYKKPQTERMKKEYHNSKQMFNKLDLPDLISRCNTNYLTPEWEIPKGRRSYRESNLNCAIREFEEETDIKSHEYDLITNVLPISEEYIGCNGVRYKHIYYYAISKEKKDISINLDKYEQYSEIGDIKWFTLEEAYNIIRPDNIKKKEIIQKTKQFVEGWSLDFFFNE